MVESPWADPFFTNSAVPPEAAGASSPGSARQRQRGGTPPRDETPRRTVPQSFFTSPGNGGFLGGGKKLPQNSGRVSGHFALPSTQGTLHPQSAIAPGSHIGGTTAAAHGEVGADFPGAITWG